MTKQIHSDGFLIAQAQPTQTVFTNQVPSGPNSNSSDGGILYELGMKFRSAKVGRITAIRYWKASSETGSHTGKIWTTGGSVLASITFSNETASGWQQQALSTPLNIQANMTYVVSYNSNGFFGYTNGGLASSFVNRDLSTVAGNNGVYASPNGFPTNSWQNSNYWVDVVFVADSTLTITKVSGDNQSRTAGTTLTNPLVVQVKNSAGNPQAGVTVNFAVTSGAGSVSPTNPVTNANGQASTVLTLGTKAGTNTVSATASGAGSVTFSATANPATTNPIYLENLNPGTEQWKIDYANLATTEIVGYAAATSVNKGGSLPIKVSLAQSGQFTIDVYRLGYYGGKGGRLLVSSGPRNGITQPACSFDSTTRLVECNWSTSYTVAVGANWTSGMYVAKLTGQTTDKQSHVWFVVRDDSSSSDVLFQLSFTTYLAYNTSGDYSLYDFQSKDRKRAYKVSFDRPFSQTTANDTPYDMFTRWERNLMRWMESQGYDISYVTNMDVHANPNLLRQHKVFLSVGHDEYWSMEERNNVEQARDAGVNLAFFSANTAYWRVHFENGSTGGTNRVMVCYKDKWADYPAAPTNKFRSPQNKRPENALLGVMYTGENTQLYNTGANPSSPSFSGRDFVVKNSDDLYYANTNLSDGDKLSMLVGFEWDAVVNNGATPSGLVVLSESPVTPPPTTATDQDLPLGTDTRFSNAVRYTADSGAKVFATGSIHWMWGLDSDGIKPSKVDRRAQQIAVNVLADMGARPLIPGANIIVP